MQEERTITTQQKNIIELIKSFEKFKDLTQEQMIGLSGAKQLNRGSNGWCDLTTITSQEIQRSLNEYRLQVDQKKTKAIKKRQANEKRILCTAKQCTFGHISKTNVRKHESRCQILRNQQQAKSQKCKRSQNLLILKQVSSQAHEFYKTHQQKIQLAFLQVLTRTFQKNTSKDLDYQSGVLESIKNLEIDKYLTQQKISIINKHMPVILKSSGSDRSTRQLISSFQFFQQTSDFDLIYQSRIIFGLGFHSQNKTTQIIRLHRKICKIEEEYQKLPDLINNEFGKLKKFGFYANILQQIQKTDATLFTDTWLFLTLGLRLRQLKTIVLEIKENVYARAIKIKEISSGENLIRVVPKSLISLIKKNKVTLPITQDRIKKVIETLLTTTNRLYSFKHFYSFHVIEVLHKLYGISFFQGYNKQQQIQTCEKFYALYDEELSLNMQEEDNQINQIIDFTLNQTRSCQKMNIQFDNNNSILQAYEQDKIFTKIQWEKQIEQISYLIFRDHKLLLKDGLKTESCESLCHFLMHVLQQNELFQDGNYQNYQQSQLLKKVSQMGFNVTLLKNKLGLSHLNSESSLNLFIVQVQNRYYQVQQSQVIEKIRNSVKQHKNNKSKIYQLYQQRPKCVACKETFSVKANKNYGKVVCNCQKMQIQESTVQIKPIDSIKISAPVKKLNMGFHQLEIQNNQNNLRKCVEKKKLSYIKNPVYSSKIDHMQTNYCRFADSQVRKIIKNRENQQFLPLKIQNCGQFGQGMFTTADIQENTLVMSYIGVISTQEQALIKGDSVVRLGWLKKKNQVHQLLINTDTRSNSARFLNDNKQCQNCSLCIGLIGNQVTAVLYTNQFVQKGAELCWNYGHSYWLYNFDQVPTVSASEQQMQNFQRFAQNLYDEFSKNVGAVKIKVDPPKKIKLDDLKSTILTMKSQKLKKLKESLFQISCYGQKKISFKNYWQSQNKQITQEEFWKRLQKNKSCNFEYAPDINLKRSLIFSQNDPILRTIDQLFSGQITGINSSYIFVGKAGASFGIHVQDFHFFAVNFHLFGAQKIWYVLNPSDKEKFDEYVYSLLGDKDNKCGSFHKNLMIDPNQLNKKFKLNKIVQKYGQIVLTFPKGYHFGFNRGRNINQAFNLWTPKVLQSMLSFKNCGCGMVPPFDKVKEDYLKKNKGKNESIALIKKKMRDQGIIQK